MPLSPSEPELRLPGIIEPNKPLLRLTDQRFIIYYLHHASAEALSIGVSLEIDLKVGYLYSETQSPFASMMELQGILER